MIFILGKEFKDAIDNHTRQNITNKQLADMVISDRRKIQPYKIQDKFYVWRDNRAVHQWVTLRVVECDYDDAIAYKNMVAQELNVAASKLRVIAEQEMVSL